MNALVTGAEGVVGRWLVSHLRASDDRVTPLDHASLDVTDSAAVAERVSAERPEAIYHLAAITSEQTIRRDPLGAYRVNVLGTVNLLEAVRRHAPQCAVLVPGSAQVYGAPAPDDLPLTEDRPLHPCHHYAASKAAQEACAQAYAAAHRIRALITRSFNHTGPGQSPDFLVPSLAVQILRGGRVEVGNLDVARDFTDVRDIVRAYRLLVLRGEPGLPYNVCSGRAVTIRWILELLADQAGVRVEPVVEAARVRPEEPLELRGSHARLTSATGWEPEIPLARTLADVLGSLRAENRCGPS